MTERYTPGNGTVVSMTNLDVDCKKKKTIAEDSQIAAQ